MNETFNAEVRSGQRFAFGHNWSRFLQVPNDDRILQAQGSLRDMLGLDDLQGNTFSMPEAGRAYPVSPRGDWGRQCTPSTTTHSP